MSEMEKKLLGGRYRIDALIGRGGMSDVYRGMDVVLQRQVAIKILTDRSEDLRKRFLREAQSMARLNHTNIVGVYDAAQNDGVSYIVMELVQGRTLATISPSELTVHTALRYILELLEAQRAGLVLVGAQAIYLHAPAEQAHLYTYTLDGDLALDPDLLTESPDIGRVLVDAGYTEGQNPEIGRAHV